MRTDSLNHKRKTSNERFFGKLEEISVPTIIDYIIFSCIVNIESDKGSAALFFNDGKLSDVRLNDEIDINKVDEIINWKKGDFTFCKWGKNTETDISYLKDIIHFTKIIKGKCKLKYENNKGLSGNIYIENGYIKDVIFNGISGIEGLRNFLLLKNGTFITEDIDFTDIKSNMNIGISELNRLIKSQKNSDMDVKKLNNAIETLKSDLGDGLISCDIFQTGTGQAIASFNPQPKATALFERLTGQIQTMLDGANFLALDKYYLIDVKGDTLAVVLQFDKYQWAMLIDEKKANLGLLLNVAVPNARKALEEAIKG
ncbi:MAG: DUF4388 domain-containing protein [Chlorobi bacterium]|nr:DUF4388 domain-containing protein [Chlorobiota bacterium]